MLERSSDQAKLAASSAASSLRDAAATEPPMHAESGPVEPVEADVRRPRGAPFPIVGIGASAGGLEAFSELLAALPLDTGMAFVLVQHLDPLHESALTQLLARTTKLPVQEVSDALRVAPDHVYVIPPNANLSIEAGVLALEPRAQGRQAQRSIDCFFESLAQDQQERAIGVVLSGAASDGTLGLEAIKAAGGLTFAQDDTAKYDSMPRSAAAAGCVDAVLSPAGIAHELARIARHPYLNSAPGTLPSRPERDHADAITHQHDLTPLPSGGNGSPDVGAARSRDEAEHGVGGDGFKRVLVLLRKHCGVDFSLYKSSTIQRRIARRMLLCRQNSLAQYARFLVANAQELDTLFSDVLISVTSFFRNPDAFEVLQREVLPKLLAQRGDDPLRVWVLGCSTGQEAYSIAMSFIEAAELVPGSRTLQIFATDLNEALLDKARRGLYAKSLASDLTPDRLKRFFVDEGGGYRVNKSLREMVVFARQNLISDPPFSRIDIITCRNLLIYLEPSLQKKVFPMFHYALKPNGLLWLGASESIGGFTELFEPLDRKQKMYVKKAAVTPVFALPAAAERSERAAAGMARRRASAAPGAAELGGQSSFGALDAQREADRVTVKHFAPPGVLINAQRQVLQFRGATGAYLEPASGTASFDLLKMARDGLMLPLRSAIAEALEQDKTVRRENVRIEQGGTARLIHFEVAPLRNLRERCLLVFFREAQPSPPALRPGDLASASPEAAHARADRQRIAELESELAETREYLESVRETHDAATEELQSASEETLSANEELQSLNEELTTSKEELESSNEELTTLNDELASRNAELARLDNDLVNVQTSAHLVIVLLGRDLRIRRFSLQAQKQFNLLPADIGRPLGHVRHRLAIDDIETLVAKVVATSVPFERDVEDRDGRWYSLRLRPYVMHDGRVDGAVLVLVDIDTLKRSERALRDTEAQYLALFAATSVGVSEADPANGRLLRVNAQFARIVGRPTAELVGRPQLELTHPEDRPTEQAGYARLLAGADSGFESEKRLLCDDGRTAWVHSTVNLVRAADGQPLRTVAITLDITERRLAQEALRVSEERYHTLFDSMDEGFCIIEMLFDEHGKPCDYRFLEVNPAFQKQSGMAGVVGKRMLELAPEHEAHWFATYGKVALLGEPLRFVNQANSLNKRWFDVYAFRLGGPESRRVATLFTDVTERKQAAESAVESDRRKSEFLAMLAHELRNPLAPIRNALQILRLGADSAPAATEAGLPLESGVDHPPDPAQATLSAIEMMERQVAHMVRLVDDLLDVSRISLGKISLRIERVSLAAVVTQAVQATRPLVELMGHDLTVALPSEPVPLEADATRLVQIIGNLVTNACKFTARGGRIALSAHLDEQWLLVQPVAALGASPLESPEPATRQATQVVIRVRDNGIGIAQSELPRIFQMFTQVDTSLGRSTGGLGIGLALVKDLVALHGGTVVVHSAGIGRGSEFEVRLPLAAALPPGAPPTASTVPAGAPQPVALRILLVDDNHDAVDSLALLLALAGHETHLAHDGLQAVSAAQSLQPDVILLDLGLPGIDGFEAARRIRKQTGGKCPLLVAITGWGQPEDRRRTTEAGFDAHLVKPVELDDLMGLLAGCGVAKT